MGKLIIALAIGTLLLLIPLAVLADEYIAGEAGTIYTQVFYGNGTPANSANVILTLQAANGTKILDGVSMTYMTSSEGMYKYDFTCPDGIGTYIASAVSSNPTGYGSSDIHVSSPISANYTYTGNFTYTGANASQIWGENTADFDDSSTFGGLINNIIGGIGKMLENPIGLPQIIFVIALCGFALWKKDWLRILLSICIIIWGAFSMPYDIKIAAPLITIGTTLFIMGILTPIKIFRGGE